MRLRTLRGGGGGGELGFKYEPLCLFAARPGITVFTSLWPQFLICKKGEHQSPSHEVIARFTVELAAQYPRTMSGTQANR